MSCVRCEVEYFVDCGASTYEADYGEPSHIANERVTHIYCPPCSNVLRRLERIFLMSLMEKYGEKCHNCPSYIKCATIGL